MKRILVFLLLLLAILLISCNDPAGSSEEESLAESLPPFESGDFVVTLDGELFNSSLAELAHFTAESGKTYTFTVHNNTEESLDFRCSLTLAYEVVGIMPNHLASMQTTTFTLRTTEAGEACLNVFLGNGDKAMHFPADSTALVALVSDPDIEGAYVYLRSSLDIVGMRVRYPFNMQLQGHALNLKELRFQSQSEGAMTIVSEGKLNAEQLFFDTPNWEVSFDITPSVLKGDDAGFYARIKKLNGIAQTGGIVVKSYENWLILLDENDFPRFENEADIYIDGDFSLLPPDQSEYVYIITYSLSLRISESVDIANCSLYFATRQAGTISIEIEQPYPDDFIIFDTPNCAVFWADCTYLNADNFYLHTNIASFNGALPGMSLGGLGSGLVLDVVSDNENIDFEIHGNLIIMHCKYSVVGEQLKAVAAEFVCENGTPTLPAECVNNDKTFDLSEDRILTVTDNDGKTRLYLIRASLVRNDLPIIYLTTKDKALIESKTEYVEATFSLEYGDSIIQPTTLGIRGRGNSTWTMDKKPYRLKFDEKISLFGGEPNKDWVLLASYADKSFMRNLLALELANVLSNMKFSSMQQLVDVFMNGEYIGVYLLTEHIEVAKGRVEISEDEAVDTGYLLEIGGTNDDDVYGVNFFHAGTIKFAAIKSPKEPTKEQYKFIYEYVLKADNAVKNLDNYEDYIDIPSLIDWFILHELGYNVDNCFRRSCFITKDAGGKLVMGPAWDFDLAFANLNRSDLNYKSWASVGSDDKDAYVKITWMNYLLKDPKFMTQLKARWAEVNELLLEKAMEIIDYHTSLIEKSQIENFKIWQIMGTKVPFESKIVGALPNYAAHIEYLKDFILERKSWMDSQLK